jgi:hypothetical protein
MTVSLIDALAEVCHEVKRAYLLESGIDNPRWKDAPDAVQLIAKMEVEKALFSDLTPRQHHALWLEQHKGWKFASVEDAEAKVSPLCCPYDELTLSQRACWALSHAIVKTVASQTGG